MGIECTVNADVKEKGSIVINSRMFGEIVRKLPDSEILFQVKDNFIVVIECDNSYFEVKGLSSEGFPMLPEIEEDKKIALSQSSLKDMIHKMIQAISADENRKILTGHCEAENGDFNMVSRDGFRLP